MISMLKSHHHFFRLLFQLTDAITVIASWLLAYWIRFDLRPDWLPTPEPTIQLSDYAPVALPLVLIWFLSLQINGAYKSWRSSRIGLELLNVIKSSGIAFVVFVAAQHFIARENLSRATTLIFLVAVTAGLIFSRIILRTTLYQMRRRGLNQRHVILVGDGVLADNLFDRLRMRPELGLQVLGFIKQGRDSKLVKTLGVADDLVALLQKHHVDHILICLRNEDVPKLDTILAVMGEFNVSVRVIPDISPYAVLGFEVEEFEGLPVISLNQSPLVGWSSVLKRLSDIVYAIFALLVFGVPMIVIAIIIKLTSRGPILYSQERMGLDGRTFKMLKFRSMRTDAEVQTGAVWAKENDPRVTWIGGVLRKTSLDELPQFFNVLKGDMSCVGPRPERPIFVDQFKSQIPGYMLRHKVKAGMTGWAQINGFRGNTSLEGRIQYDLYYITHWSLGFDLKIMFMTLFKGFINPNAY